MSDALPQLGLIFVLVALNAAFAGTELGGPRRGASRRDRADRRDPSVTPPPEPAGADPTIPDAPATNGPGGLNPDRKTVTNGSDR